MQCVTFSLWKFLLKLKTIGSKKVETGSFLFIPSDKWLLLEDQFRRFWRLLWFYPTHSLRVEGPFAGLSYVWLWSESPFQHQQLLITRVFGQIRWKFQIPLCRRKRENDYLSLSSFFFFFNYFFVPKSLAKVEVEEEEERCCQNKV